MALLLRVGCRSVSLHPVVGGSSLQQFHLSLQIRHHHRVQIHLHSNRDQLNVLWRLYIIFYLPHRFTDLDALKVGSRIGGDLMELRLELVEEKLPVHFVQFFHLFGVGHILCLLFWHRLRRVATLHQV